MCVLDEAICVTRSDRTPVRRRKHDLDRRVVVLSKSGYTNYNLREGVQSPRATIIKPATNKWNGRDRLYGIKLLVYILSPSSNFWATRVLSSTEIPHRADK